MTTSAETIGEIDPQAEVVAFLESPSTLHRGEAARRIDTHAARIFLAGDRAWKLKRAVHFSYLDFSSPDKRREALETELRLNVRTAPDIYLAVHPICRDRHGGLNIGGVGEPIDWLLEMRRFPDEALLEDVAGRGELTDKLVVQLAAQIKAFHDDAEQCSVPGGRALIEAVIAGNLKSMAAIPDILPPETANALVERQTEETVRHAALLDVRARTGRIRHGHGDLHLANIAVIDGSPVLFDCLEFSTVLATTDVLYDLAFLIMDLWARGFRSQANMLLNRYLDLSPQDEPAIALIPLFLSVRATIRAHATAAQASSSPQPDLKSKARLYLALAEELLKPSPPRLVAIGGLSGTGKSTIARLIASGVGQPPGARILRSDVLRKRLAGLPPETPLASDAYTAAASEAVYGELARLADNLLQAGQTAIADAVYARREERSAIENLAGLRGVRFDGIWLEADPELLKQRVAARVNDASDANAAVAEAQARYNVGRIDWNRVGAGAGPEDVAGEVRAILDGGSPKL